MIPVVTPGIEIWPRKQVWFKFNIYYCSHYLYLIFSHVCVHPQTSAAQAERDREESAAEERREAAAWAIGAKCDKKAMNAMERDRKLQLKAERCVLFRHSSLHFPFHPFYLDGIFTIIIISREAIIAEEELEFAGVNKRGFTSAKKKKGKKDDVDMLQAALKTQVKTKAQLKMEEKIKKAEDRKSREEEARKRKQEIMESEEKYRMEQAKLGICVDHTDDLLTHSKENNFLEELEDTMDRVNSDSVNDLGNVETIFVSGLDSALEAFKEGKPAVEPHPEKRRNALYKAFEEEMMPALKVEYPGLRRTQYLEKINALWQKSEQNPDNVR